MAAVAALNPKEVEGSAQQSDPQKEKGQAELQAPSRIMVREPGSETGEAPAVFSAKSDLDDPQQLEFKKQAFLDESIDLILNNKIAVENATITNVPGKHLYYNGSVLVNHRDQFISVEAKELFGKYELQFEVAALVDGHWGHRDVPKTGRESAISGMEMRVSASLLESQLNALKDV